MLSSLLLPRVFTFLFSTSPSSTKCIMWFPNLTRMPCMCCQYQEIITNMPLAPVPLRFQQNNEQRSRISAKPCCKVHTLSIFISCQRVVIAKRIRSADPCYSSPCIIPISFLCFIIAHLTNHCTLFPLDEHHIELGTWTKWAAPALILLLSQVLFFPHSHRLE